MFKSLKVSINHNDQNIPPMTLGKIHLLYFLIDGPHTLHYKHTKKHAVFLVLNAT